MPLKFHPYPGQILRCDFSTGFKVPEMVKPRPVIVISPKPQHVYTGVCIVVCLSTTPPEVIRPFHREIELPDRVPENLQKSCWLKGDMIYTVSLNRLDLYRMDKDKDGRRIYYQGKFSGKDVFDIRCAAMAACGLPACIKK